MHGLKMSRSQRQAFWFGSTPRGPFAPALRFGLLRVCCFAAAAAAAVVVAVKY